MAQAYPMMVDLVGQSVLVVGGGTVAERKVLTLLPTEAKITVVSPTATQQLQIAAKQGRLELLSREYRSSDGENSMIVIMQFYGAICSQARKIDDRNCNRWH
jgi:precorrin-2 dehydrogenase/sirohydrochlorin ferrochelatase